ncbi:MAG: flagellar biosynthesis protein FlgL [Rhizobiales bacterium]|nr:flagellar biosynthesis protein FlgL [Hyphomicrobiales bacterium]
MQVISSLAQALNRRSDVAKMQTQMADLNRQLTTGIKSDSYSGLGTSRNLVLSLQNQIKQLETYQNTIKTTQLRMETMSSTLTRVNDISREMKTSGLTADFDLVNGKQTGAQQSAGMQLDELVSLMNLKVEDRSLFGGRDTQTTPVVLPDLMLNGDTTHAGLKQVIAERKTADLGADGMGRLSFSSTGAGNVTLTEDNAVFGFKLAAVNSSLSGTTVTGPTGSPAALGVDFGGTLPSAGETISLDLALPDGTTTTVSLKVTAASPAGKGEFTIGADATATAANFQAALDTSLKAEAGSTLRAASSVQASNEFFDNNPPLRVDGTGNGLVAGTSDNTVIWYKGDSSGTAGNNFVTQIGEGQQIAYGARADQSALRDTIKSAALLSAVEYDETDTNASASYSALQTRVSEKMTFKNTESVKDIVTDLGLKSSRIDQTETRQANLMSTAQGLLDDTQASDDYEVSVKITALQTQLQASYQVTSMVTSLSLVNFL